MSAPIMEQAVAELGRQNELVRKQFHQLVGMKEAVGQIAQITAQRKNALLADNEKLRSLLARKRQERSDNQECARREDRAHLQLVNSAASSSSRITWEAVRQNPAPSPMTWVPNHHRASGENMNTCPASVDPNNSWEACD